MEYDRHTNLDVNLANWCVVAIGYLECCVIYLQQFIAIDDADARCDIVQGHWHLCHLAMVDIHDAVAALMGDDNLLVWGYCQDGRNYMPTDELIPQGGYEVVRANTYTKAGPGPFKVGINAAAEKTFRELAGRI